MLIRICGGVSELLKSDGSTVISARQPLPALSQKTQNLRRLGKAS